MGTLQYVKEKRERFLTKIKLQYVKEKRERFLTKIKFFAIKPLIF